MPPAWSERPRRRRPYAQTDVALSPWTQNGHTGRLADGKLEWQCSCAVLRTTDNNDERNAMVVRRGAGPGPRLASVVAASVAALSLLGPLSGSRAIASELTAADEVREFSMSDREAFQANAAEIAGDFKRQEESPVATADADPASTFDPHPELRIVEKAVELVAPGAFAGAYRDGDTVRVGLTGPAGTLIGVINRAVPNVRLAAFRARHPLSQLNAVNEAITQTMSSDPGSGIVSVGPDIAENVVRVGVDDANSSASHALLARYGDVISLFEEAPFDLRVAPRRNSFRNPIPGGPNMVTRGATCTVGFPYGAPTRQDPFGLGAEQGVMSAGHCFAGNVPTQEWRQGGRTLGSFTRTRYVNGSSADAGTLTTVNRVLSFRRVTNAVYLGPSINLFRITRRLARNSSQLGDPLLVSGAQSGLGTGAVATGGAGRSYVFRLSNRIITIRNANSANVSEDIVNGDSGAPVFRGDGVAMGIVFASQRANPRRMIYSQIQNVEAELGVTTCTGRSPAPKC